MLARVKSVATVGLTAVEVAVEVDVSKKGFPAFDVVGLPDKAVGEARARVKKAIENSGASFPDKRITVNLAPADLPKEGSNYDLPIAIGVMMASGEIENIENDTYYYGELGLDGSLRQGKGILLAALLAKEKGIRNIYVSKLSATEGAVVSGINVYPVTSLAELIQHLRGEKKIEILESTQLITNLENQGNFIDFSEIKGQESAKRAAEIAAAGGHNLLLVGPPGAGKTMLAKAFPGILPPLLPDEALEVTRIYSVCGLIDAGKSLMRQRPYRSPHHTTSMVAMIGGGSIPIPGEVSLAHLGVLFLDEMPEFPRSVLEVLRQPMEDGKICISRAKARAEFPAEFTLLASANPCPCGYLNHPLRECNCGERAITKYRHKLSGPILDRIDLHVWVDPVEVNKLVSTDLSSLSPETSKEIRERIKLARKIQEVRFREFKGIYTNSQMSNKQLRVVCDLDEDARKFLTAVNGKYDLSARAYFKVLKVARTIADLETCKNIEIKHLAEAVQYRENVW